MTDATGPETPAVLQAHRFELLGRQGAVRAVLGELPNPDDTAGPVVGLAILDGDGRPRMWLALLPTGPNLIFDQDGANALEMGVDDPTADAVRTGPYLYLAAPDGSPVAGWRGGRRRVRVHHGHGGGVVNVVVLRGRLSRPATERVLASGDRLLTLEVTVPRPGHRADTVPVVAVNPPPAVVLFDPGEEVLVVGRLRRRFSE